jgi:hypothetical protein
MTPLNEATETHTTKSPAQLRAEIAEREAALAAMEAEPDWGPAVQRFRDVYFPHHGTVTEGIKAGLEAALPLAPRQAEAMDDAGVEALAREVCAKWSRGDYPGFVSLASTAIRETLKRAPRWPGEEELREMASGASFATHSPYEAAREMARRLREWQTGGAANGAVNSDWNGIEPDWPTAEQASTMADDVKRIHADRERYRILGEQAGARRCRRNSCRVRSVAVPCSLSSTKNGTEWLRAITMGYALGIMLRAATQALAAFVPVKSEDAALRKPQSQHGTPATNRQPR